MTFTNDKVVFNSIIVEWDIRRANVSLMRYYNLYDDDKLKSLEKMRKKDREVKVGLLCRENKELSKALSKSFDTIMEEFLTANNLDKDYDILSIKKDAAFVINKEPVQTVFGPVVFIPKNVYKGFIQIGRYEFYIKSDNTFDVKGWPKNIDINIHKDGVLDLIRETLNVAEANNGDLSAMAEFLHSFADNYKKKNLDFEYYREFNEHSDYLIHSSDYDVRMTDISEEFIDECDISFNYKNIFLPLMRKFL